jgi:hypothetical protein
MKPKMFTGLLALALSLALGASVATARADQSALNGTYRVTITDADLRAHGVTNQGAIRENHGIFTLTLRNGSWRLRQRTNNPVHQLPPAPYTIKGDLVTFVFRVPGAPDGAPPPFTFHWMIAHGKLRFALIAGKDPYKIVPTLFTAHPWTKLS